MCFLREATYASYVGGRSQYGQTAETEREVARPACSEQRFDDRRSLRVRGQLVELEHVPARRLFEQQSDEPFPSMLAELRVRR